MRDDRRNYVLVGAFVLAMVAATVVWVARLSGRTGATDAYHVVYDRVLSLSPGTQVYYQGYPVGRIESVAPAEGGPAEGFQVEFTVRRGWPIPEDSVAAVTAAGMLSAVIIDIEAGTSTRLLRPGDRIAGREASGVFTALSSAAARISALVAHIEPLVDSVSADAPEILASMRTLIADLDRTAKRLSDAIDPATVATAKSTLQNFETTSEQSRALAASATRTLNDLDALVTDVRQLLATEEGELGHALVDLHATLEAVARYVEAIARNLETTSRNTAEFSRQLRENPSILLRGREKDDGGSP